LLQWKNGHVFIVSHYFKQVEGMKRNNGKGGDGMIIPEKEKL